MTTLGPSQHGVKTRAVTAIDKAAVGLKSFPGVSARMYACVRRLACACARVRLRMRAHVHVCVCVRGSACVCVRASVRGCVRVFACVRAGVRA